MQQYQLFKIKKKMDTGSTRQQASGINSIQMLYRSKGGGGGAWDRSAHMLADQAKWSSLWTKQHKQ